MILCLDLSGKTTGWSKFSKDGKLLKYGRITPDPSIDSLFRLHYVVNEIQTLYGNVDELIIEGIFLGMNVKTFEYLAKIAGAIIYTWIVNKYKLPIIYKASEARKLAGVKGNSQKAEIQLWVINEYGFAKPKQIAEWQTVIDGLKEQYKTKALKKGQFKYRMGKLSILIDKETGIGEDLADSIVLGRSYANRPKIT